MTSAYSQPWFKDPADTAWYQFDWSVWLPFGVTVSSATITVDSNITLITHQLDGNLVQFRVSGGTNGTESEITCQITDSNSDIFQTVKTIFIKERQS